MGNVFLAQVNNTPMRNLGDLHDVVQEFQQRKGPIRIMLKDLDGRQRMLVLRADPQFSPCLSFYVTYGKVTYIEQ